VSVHDFEWDEANTGHLARHGVTPNEFQQAFGHPRLEEQFSSGGEHRVLALGRTDAGRYLTLVYTVRGEKIRAVTAHTTKRKYRRVYDEAIRADASAATEDPEV
jgi:uncharacterized DUF497 family protein